MTQHDNLRKSNILSNLLFMEMAIGNGISLLEHLLSAIKKWENITWEEFSDLENDYKKKYPNGFSEYFDPITDKASMLHRTGLALYGSFSINIVALVEGELNSICEFLEVTILKDGNKAIAKKPHFSDYLYSLEKKFKFKKESIKHYENHQCIRELANRFKHSGGKITEKIKIEPDEDVIECSSYEDINYNEYPWDEYIIETKELLLDFVEKIRNANT